MNKRDDNRVTLDDLETAIMWLENNEGEACESKACRVVADMLRREASSRMNQMAAREAAKHYGVPYRKALQAVLKVARAKECAS